MDKELKEKIDAVINTLGGINVCIYAIQEDVYLSDSSKEFGLKALNKEKQKWADYLKELKGL